MSGFACDKKHILLCVHSFFKKNNMHGFNIVVLLVSIGFFFGNFVAIAVDICIYHYIHPLTYAIVTTSVLFAVGVLWVIMAAWPDGRLKNEKIRNAYNKVMTSPYYSAPIWVGWGAFFVILVLAIALLWTYIGLFGASPDPQIGSGGVVPFGTSAESDYYFNLMLILCLVFLLEFVAAVYHFSAYYRAWIRTSQLAEDKHVNPENPQGIEKINLSLRGGSEAQKKNKLLSSSSYVADKKPLLTRDPYSGSEALTRLPMTSDVMAGVRDYDRARISRGGAVNPSDECDLKI